MVLCAKFAGRDPDTCTRGKACHCLNEPSGNSGQLPPCRCSDGPYHYPNCPHRDPEWVDPFAALGAAMSGRALAQQPAAEAQGGGEVVWRVPVLQSPFGERLDHGVRDELVLVMHRGAHGWKAAGQGHALLAHQLYVKNVEPLCAESHEVSVVGLYGGGWRTVWARSDDDVTHPAPPSAPVGVGGLSDVFNLVRACESAVRRLGWRSSDYSLGHEARMLAQGYENGAFQTARETLHALAQQPAAVDGAWLSKARELYDRCKLWPENSGDGFIALLELRNHVGDALAAQPGGSDHE